MTHSGKCEMTVSTKKTKGKGVGHAGLDSGSSQLLHIRWLAIRL